MSDIIIVTHKNLGNLLADKAPYIFVDTAEIIPGKSAKGVKNFTHNEWFFACHFPNNPVVPGVFTLEALMQTAALVVYSDKSMNADFVYAKKFKEVDLISAVYPGERLETEIEIISMKRGIEVLLRYTVKGSSKETLKESASAKLFLKWSSLRF